MFLIEDLILLTIAVEIENANGSDEFIHSRYKKYFHKQLIQLERIRRQRRIPRSALLSPGDSPWKKVYTSRNDQALITLTGLDFASFEMVECHFSHYFNRYTPFTNDGKIALKLNNKGRKRFITAADGLGLVLAWTRTRGSVMVLELIFGLTQTPVSMICIFAWQFSFTSYKGWMMLG